MRNPSDIFIDQYRVAAGEGAVLELKMRLLANKVPRLRPFVDEHLEDVEEQIITAFAKHLSDTEQAQLQTCRQLRNKVLHCDFPKARSKLHELGAPKVRGGIRQFRFNSQTPEGIAKDLEDAAPGRVAGREVADMTSKAEANIYGWLLELGTAGDFQRAADVFRVACGILDRLFEASNGLTEEGG
jgi:hypothetical protein